MKVNAELKDYIEKNIFPSYEKNDLGHNLDHIKYVIERSMGFAQTLSDIDYDMVYVIASYHDIGHYIDADNHERVSGEMLQNDRYLKKFFSDSQIKQMAEAVCDHRASLDYEPRSIYGKIVSSADRNVTLDFPLKRTYSYRIAREPDAPLEEIIESSRKHILEKFGREGYAKEKMYFKDEQYEQFLKEIVELAENTEAFKKRYLEANGLNSNR